MKKIKRFVVLGDLIELYGYTSMIEIGVGRGEVARYILDRFGSDFEYYGIDPFRAYDEYRHDVNATPERIISNDRKTREILNPVEYAKHIFKLKSEHMVNFFKHDSIGLVFVDGNHDYEYVKMDTEIYYDFLIDGGIMAFHDYGHPNFQGVKEAVDEFVHIYDLHLTTMDVSDIVYFKKPCTKAT